MEREGDWKRDAESAGDAAGETLLPEHDFETSEGAKDGDGDDDGHDGARASGGRRSIRTTVWLFLQVTTTLAARTVLRSGFRESDVLPVVG